VGCRKLGLAARGHRAWGKSSRSLSGFLIPISISPGRCPGLLSCCIFGAQDLEPHLLAPFGLWPLRSNPIFVFFVAFVVKIIRIGTRRPGGNPTEKRSRASLARIIHSLSKRRAGTAVLTRLYARGTRRHSHPLCRAARGWGTPSARMITALQPTTRELCRLVGTDTQAKEQSVPSLANSTVKKLPS